MLIRLELAEVIETAVQQELREARYRIVVVFSELVAQKGTSQPWDFLSRNNVISLWVLNRTGMPHVPVP